MAARGSGSVTSPIPQRIQSSGRFRIRFRLNSRTRRAISGKQIAGLKLEIIFVQIGHRL
jgi:hypothetical protein